MLYIGDYFIKAKENVSGDYTIDSSTKAIAGGAFENCTKLKSVIIPDGIKNLEKNTFSYCSDLISITIPKSVTKMRYSTFENCKKLKKVNYGSNMKNWNNIDLEMDFGFDIYDDSTYESHSGIFSATIYCNSSEKMVLGDWVNSKYKKPSIKKISGENKQIMLTWKKVSGVKGYQIQYSTSKKFNKNKTKSVTVKSNKAKVPSKIIKKLKNKTTYYVRIRSYKTVKVKGENIKVYSEWSNVKSVKTK